MRVLQESIIDTLAFFAIFDWPLTATEVYDRLWDAPAGVGPSEVIVELERMAEAGIIASEGGYFALENMAVTRERRRGAHWLVAHKLKRARRALRYAAWVPFVRAVFICNTVAFGWPRAQSDIDVFVVVRRERLWLARFFLTIAIQVSGYRRHGKHVADRVCLSFYITDNVLDLNAVRRGDNDVLLTYWSLFLHPLYDPENVAASIRQSNQWAVRRIPHAPSDSTLHPHAPRFWVSTVFKKMLEKIFAGQAGSTLNDWLGAIQKRKMQGNTASVQNFPDSRVVVSDTMLKFHENDRRDLYREQWDIRRQAAKARMV